MPLKVMYQIRSVETGRLSTVIASSPHGAIKKFTDEKDPPDGDFDVKARGEPSSAWQRFRIR